MISNEILKNKILDDAMHGLLVKNHEKNSMDELTEIITTNKAKSNKKDLSTFSLEIPYDIPKNWNWVELGKIVEINLGFTHTPKYVSDGVKFLSVKDISSGYIDFNNVKYVSEEEYDTAPYGAKPHKGDILFGRVGTIGVPQIIETDDKFCIFVSLGFLRDFSNKLNKKFICYWMYSNTFKNQVYHVVKGAAQVNLNTKWLQSFLIPFPPLEEQEEIVKKIDGLFELIDKKEQNDNQKSKLKQVLKERILYNAIHGTLVDNDLSLKPVDVDEINEVAFEIPSNWKWSCFGKMADKITDGTHSTPKYTSDGIPFLSVKDMSNGKLSFDSCKYISKEEHDSLYKRCDPKKGDLLITKVGTTGVPVIVDVDFEFSLFVSVALLRFNQEKFDNRFLKYVVQSSYVQNIIDENTKGMANKNWVIKKIAETPIPIPPLEEQKRIVEKIESLFELIEQL